MKSCLTTEARCRISNLEFRIQELFTTEVTEGRIRSFLTTKCTKVEKEEYFELRNLHFELLLRALRVLRGKGCIFFLVLA